MKVLKVSAYGEDKWAAVRLTACTGTVLVEVFRDDRYLTVVEVPSAELAKVIIESMKDVPEPAKRKKKS